jgi:uncharacterized damage-inducible protein DinB
VNLRELLQTQAEQTYRTAEILLGMVEDTELNWKPSQGTNWWTVGQLLRHMTVSCGIWCKGFVEGTWDDAGDVDYDLVSVGAGLPPAEAYRSVENVAGARAALAVDKATAFRMIEKTSEEDLANKKVAAPWNPAPRALVLCLLDMIRHLESHRAQLYSYLKLMGKPVHTGHLWGMGGEAED